MTFSLYTLTGKLLLTLSYIKKFNFYESLALYSRSNAFLKGLLSRVGILQRRSVYNYLNFLTRFKQSILPFAPIVDRSREGKRIVIRGCLLLLERCSPSGPKNRPGCKVTHRFPYRLPMSLYLARPRPLRIP